MEVLQNKAIIITEGEGLHLCDLMLFATAASSLNS